MAELIEGLLACGSLLGTYWLIARAGRPSDGMTWAAVERPRRPEHDFRWAAVGRPRRPERDTTPAGGE